MFTKRTYFLAHCDFVEERPPQDFVNDGLLVRPYRCREQLTIYTPPESEGAASEYAMREIRGGGWAAFSLGRARGFVTFCPQHKNSETAKYAKKRAAQNK